MVSRQMPSQPPGSAPHISNSRNSSNVVNSKCSSMASTRLFSLKIGFWAFSAAAVSRSRTSVGGESARHRISPPEHDRTTLAPTASARRAAAVLIGVRSLRCHVTVSNGMCSPPAHSIYRAALASPSSQVAQETVV